MIVLYLDSLQSSFMPKTRTLSAESQTSEKTDAKHNKLMNDMDVTRDLETKTRFRESR